MRPHTLADLLDQPFRLLKARPRTLLAVVAAAVVPVELLTAFGQRDLFGPGVGDLIRNPEAADTAGGGADGLLVVLAVLLASLALPFVAGSVAALVVAWEDGRRAAAGEALRAVGRRWWALLASWVLVHLLEAVAFVVPLGSVFVMAAFLVTAPAIVVEGLGPLAGMGRAWELARRRFFPVLGIGVVSGLVASLLGQSLGLLPTLLGAVVGDRIGWLVVSVTAMATSLVTTLGVAGTTVFCYLDLRVRTEALDLSLVAARSGPGPGPGA